MTYSLLAGGYRKTFARLTFDPASATIKVVGEPPAPPNASWLECAAAKQSGGAQTVYASSRPDGLTIYTLSEEPKGGLAVSLEVTGDDVKVTSERHTNGGPAHVHPMKDGSAIIVSNYMGGTIICMPIGPDGKLSQTSKSPNLAFPFPYKDTKAPNPDRQDTPHPHQVIESKEGKLYVPDLGSDRIWVVKRKGEDELEIEGWLQATPGSGPRHCVLSADEKYLYCLTEMGHDLQIFSLSDSLPAHPLPHFECSIVPSSVPPEYAYKMDSAELIANPTIPNVLYGSNRWELHLNKFNPDKPALPTQRGDAVAIIFLSKEGDKVEAIKHVRTGCDSIRAMQASPDGQYVALAGQEGGGVEIYAVGGERGDEWKLAAKDETIKGITDFVWL